MKNELVTVTTQHIQLEAKNWMYLRRCLNNPACDLRDFGREIYFKTGDLVFYTDSFAATVNGFKDVCKQS